MENLKTLEDMDVYEGSGMKPNFRLISERELKAEAVKWIKWLKENTESDRCLKEIESQKMTIHIPRTTEEIKERNEELAKKLSDIRWHSRMWIMYFFDISDEDLKGE